MNAPCTDSPAAFNSHALPGGMKPHCAVPACTAGTIIVSHSVTNNAIDAIAAARRVNNPTITIAPPTSNDSDTVHATTTGHRSRVNATGHNARGAVPSARARGCAASYARAVVPCIRATSTGSGKSAAPYTFAGDAASWPAVCISGGCSCPVSFGFSGVFSTGFSTAGAGFASLFGAAAAPAVTGATPMFASAAARSPSTPTFAETSPIPDHNKVAPSASLMKIGATSEDVL